MNKQNMLSDFFNQLLNNGAGKESLNKLKEKIIKIIPDLKEDNKDKLIEHVISEMIEKSRMFLNEKNQYDMNLITSLASSIYIFDKHGQYKFKFIGGVESRYDNSKKITEETVFDIASITKLFTIILVFKLEEFGYFNINDKIIDLHPEYIGLKDFTLLDLLMMCGEIYTDGDIRSANNKDEAEKILKTAYIKNNDRYKNKYSDFGAIIISKVCEKIIQEKTQEKLTYDQIMEKYILRPYGLTKTRYNINLKTDSISGNGNLEGLVHDPKSRKLGGNVGSAGLFTNNDDLCKLAYEMYKVKYVNYDYLKNMISKDNLTKLGTIIFPHSNISQKGYLGLYQKHPLGLLKTFVPDEYGNFSFAHQGWTGQLAVFDPINSIHNSILVNTVGKQNEQNDDKYFKNNKPIGFGKYLNIYYQDMATNTLMLLFIKKYYNLYNDKNNIEKCI
ncbi:MAG TPA: beta-lactamase family protein, partial [Tenericutes bacterium]|nr:beta-lactamase family protein [Mycoplasmatota bacterium]